ncbi:MAG: hypothetical protein M1401_15000 [Chloroflexi bacterium]|nr:hypothetical protein [Chloroflexota bacterium]
MQGLAILLAGLVALVDGLIRLAGRPSLLGQGRSLARVLAAPQVLTVIALLAGFLP